MNKKRIAWNKGLTKETDERVKKYVDNGSGLPKGHIPWNKGLLGYNKDVVHTPEWNARVSIGVKRYYSDKLKTTRCGPLGRAWTQSIMERDFWTCRVCGKPAVIAHHICPWKEFPEYTLETWNGVSVCKGCHNRVHNLRVGIEKLWIITRQDLALMFLPAS